MISWQKAKACEVRMVTESWLPDMAERSKNPAANRKKTDQSPAEPGGELARVKNPADAGLASKSGERVRAVRHRRTGAKCGSDQRGFG
jgi:hypothetical protein